jgi:hypothetical protein
MRTNIRHLCQHCAVLDLTHSTNPNTSAFDGSKRLKVGHSLSRMSWPYYYTNASGFSTSVPPLSERQQGLALVGLDCAGGMSETLNTALTGYADCHLARHYHTRGAPLSHSVQRAPWLTAQPCHPHPGLCTCGFCPEGISYTRGVPLGGGLPIKLPDPEYEYLSQLAHRPLPGISGQQALEPDKPIKWRDFPRAPPKWEELPPKPPGWDELEVTMQGYERHTAECPRLRNRTFYCACAGKCTGLRPLTCISTGTPAARPHPPTRKRDRTHSPPLSPPENRRMGQDQGIVQVISLRTEKPSQSARSLPLTAEVRGSFSFGTDTPYVYVRLHFRVPEASKIKNKDQLRCLSSPTVM